MYSLKEQVLNIQTSLCYFWKEPSKVDEVLEKSILEFGVITPLFARALDYGFEVYLGQERLKVALKNEIEYLPIIIRNLTEDEIIIIRTEDNLAYKGISGLFDSSTGKQ